MTPEQISNLTNTELNEYVAGLLGWTKCDGSYCRPKYGMSKGPCLFGGGWYRKGRSCKYPLPNWSESIDRQQAPGGPEEELRRRGWKTRIIFEEDWVALSAWLKPHDGSNIAMESIDKPEARLRLEASALALGETQS